ASYFFEGGSPTQFFFKTTSGGGLASTDWQDITPNIKTGTTTSDVFSSLPVVSIEVNPTNENELWATIGGFSSAVGKERVIHSSDGGNSWFDYSNNLPIFPASAIVSEKGTNGGLYVGTDVGVFYTNNDIYPTDGWVCYTNSTPSGSLPVCIVTDLDINYTDNTIRAATMGRGIWSSSLACPTTAN